MAKKPDSPSPDSRPVDEQREATPRAARRKTRHADPAPSAAAETSEAIVPTSPQPNEQAAPEAVDPRSESRAIELPDTAQPPAQQRSERPEPRNHRELAEAIFSECDPVKIGRELLESGNDKGASVRARVFEKLADWQFGKKPAASAPKRRVRVIWTIPGPPHEPELPSEPGPPEDE
jgi:hypothetical protein